MADTLYIPVNLSDPSSPINDLFKSFARVLAEIVIEEVKKAEPPKINLTGREEAAKHLGCSKQTLTNYEKKGLIKNYGTGRKKLYNLYELENPSILRYKREL